MALIRLHLPQPMPIILTLERAQRRGTGGGLSLHRGLTSILEEVKDHIIGVVIKTLQQGKLKEETGTRWADCTRESRLWTSPSGYAAARRQTAY